MTKESLEFLKDRLDNLTYPEELFGILVGDQKKGLADQYKKLLLTWHPDHSDKTDSILATDIFVNLGFWKVRAERKIALGIYGDNKPLEAPRAPYKASSIVIGKKTLDLTGLISEGLISTVHTAEYDGDKSRIIFVKITRDSNDSDLIQREFSVLKKFQEPHEIFEDFFKIQRVYTPYPVKSFDILDSSKKKHKGEILTIPRGTYYTVQELIETKFTSGIEPKHVWWIFRRLLLTLWMGHLKGIVHGTVTPDHILVCPKEHGIVLLDWTLSADIGRKVPAINPFWKEFYPPEILGKASVNPSTDIFMAAQSAIYMLKDQIIDTKLSESLASCCSNIQRKRPQDAEMYHNKFGILLGKREYSEFIV